MGFELASKFIKASRNKTIATNQGVLSKEYDKDIRAELLRFGIGQNNDETAQYDGMGSIAILTIVLKVLLEYRDRINELEYKLAKLESKSSDAK